MSSELMIVCQESENQRKSPGPLRCMVLLTCPDKQDGAFLSNGKRHCLNCNRIIFIYTEFPPEVEHIHEHFSKR